MHITTQRDLIRAVAGRWRDTYAPFTNDKPMFSLHVARPVLRAKKVISEELDALDPETATADEVNIIIGNESWTRLSCDECGSNVDVILTVGQEPDYESRTASLCKSCVQKAANMKW